MLLRRGFLAGGLSSGLVLALPALCRAAPEGDAAGRLVSAARRQVGVTLTYDPAYSWLDYPGGDVPRERGVCTDVVVRAYRDALDIDLQVLVHEDMRRAGAIKADPTQGKPSLEEILAVAAVAGKNLGRLIRAMVTKL